MLTKSSEESGCQLGEQLDDRRTGMENNLIHRTKRLKQCHQQPFKQSRIKVQFADLPEDLLCTIFSKMPLKDVVRTSVLSRNWRHMWTCCTKLRFDGVTISSNNINAVLHQHSGKIVEEFEVKFEFDSKLVDHLNGLVDFAVSSQTKKMAFDLVPTNPVGLLDRYRFPFERLDNGSISRLQHIQLSFASLELPPHFSVFLNLRNLDLHLLRRIFKICYHNALILNVRCHIGGEIKVTQPLPRLLYLRVTYCDITKLQLNAINLKAFMYDGMRHPIDLGHALVLKEASLHFFGSVHLEDALTTLPSMLPCVQSLSLDAYVPLTTLPSVPPCVQPLCLDVYVSLEVSSLLKNTCKFSHLKYLQLKLRLYYHDSGNILSLASFLRASPCIEKLEIHPIRRLPQGEYGYLKNMHITGFVASTGELEFLLHVVESASILEVLTIEAAGMLGKDIDYEGRLKVEELTRRYLDGIICELWLPSWLASIVSMNALEAIVLPPCVALAIRRPRSGVWDYIWVNVSELAVEELTPTVVLELDFEPFNASFPCLFMSKSIGDGVQFLNRHLSSKLFQDKESLYPLLNFLEDHDHCGHGQNLPNAFVLHIFSCLNCLLLVL
uniref:F-box domain-containing protein n=1 Tax=Oryza glumipatula TaxID=40148 RepID=A0A0E0A6E6_9ORYZ